MADKEKREPKSPQKVSIDARRSKVEADKLASMPGGFGWFGDLEKMLPRLLAGKDMLDLSSRVVRAIQGGRQVTMMMGAHVLRSGVQHFVKDLMETGHISGLAMNGACVIHDFELALLGKTTESVSR